MNKLIQGLIGLLFLQLIVALAMLWSEQSSNSSPEAVSFVAATKSDINKVTIIDGDMSVELTKNDDGWYLPNWYGVPVDANKLSVALNKLIELQSTWPVTTTSNSHDRFKVTEENHQRRLILYSDDKKVGDVFLGTSPGFRKVHIRDADQDAVYAVELNTYDFPSESKQWLDKSLLAVNNVESFEIDSATITKEQEDWVLRSPDLEGLLEENELKAQTTNNGIKLDKEKVDKLLKRIEKLSVISVAENSEELDFEKSIQLKVSAEQDFTFSFLEQDGKHYVKRNDKEWIFETNGMAEKELADFSAKDFIATKEPAAENEQVAKADESSDASTNRSTSSTSKAESSMQ